MALGQVLIHESGGAVVAEVANTKVMFPFAGATISEQWAKVQLLGEAMEQDEGALIVAIDNGGIFEIGGNVTGRVIVDSLFMPNREIFYETGLVFQTSADDVALIYELTEAGEALLLI